MSAYPLLATGYFVSILALIGGAMCAVVASTVICYGPRRVFRSVRDVVGWWVEEARGDRDVDSELGRRRKHRWSWNKAADVRVSNTPTVGGTIIDISEGGIGLVLDFPVTVGEIIHIHDENGAAVRSRVVRVQKREDGRFHVGTRLVVDMIGGQG